jgi:RND family efflux transporter MFP subunit
MQSSLSCAARPPLDGKRNKNMKAFFARSKKWLLPISVLVVAYGIATVIRNAGPEIEVVTPEPQAFVVRVITAQPERVRLTVDSQGEVTAQHTIDFVSELQGGITRVAPAFVTGGYFKTGDVLLQIDPTDYELARVRAEARVAEEVETMEVEKSEAALAAEGLFPLREARVASAEARVQSARAELAQTDADLKRTRIKAPFDGRVLFTQVGLGQYVSKGQTLGRLYSTGIAEIRLPLSDRQLRYLDVPFGARPTDKLPATPVTLRAEVGGRPGEWQGELHRMEGAVDPDNRVWFAVARVNDPYGLHQPEQTTPLAIGLFVEAEIEGRTVDNVYRLPRSALRNQDNVLIADADNRLRRRKVTVLRTDFESVLITSGIEDGDRICVSPVEAFVDGLLVEVVYENVSTDHLALQK